MKIKKPKLALITGATGAIGEAISCKLLSEGYHLLLITRSQEKLNNCKNKLLVHHPDAIINTLVCDVSDFKAVNQLFHKLKNLENKINIDVLINCAGISGGGITEEINPEKWINIINTNLNSAFFVTQTILKNKLMPEGGRIINIASTGGKQGVIYGAPYCASKHGLVGFTKALGLELARNNSKITVNAVCPGFVESEMAERVREHYSSIWKTDLTDTKKRIEDKVPIGRYVEPYEVAGMVGYLISDVAGAITAQALNICGGLGNY
jgi:ketoreductase